MIQFSKLENPFDAVMRFKERRAALVELQTSA